MPCWNAKFRPYHIVREVHALQGNVDYLLKCVARDMIVLNTFVAEILLASPNVKAARTSVSYGHIKYSPGVPIEP